MRTNLTSLFIITVLLTACGTPAAAPATFQATSTQAVFMAPSDTPTAAASPTQAASPTYTPTPIPTNFGFDNFHQFVQVQSYRTTLETAVGMNITDMRMDAIAYSPDGRYIAVGGCTGIWGGNCISDVYGGHSFLYILDARTAGIVTTLPETEVTITGMTFSSDGEKLIYATNPDRIIIWGVASGQIEKVLWQQSGDAFRRVAISPDGRQIADVDSNNLRVWDVATGKVLAQKPGSNFGNKLPRFSADGKRLAVFSNEMGLEITIYDTATWEKAVVISLPGQASGVLAFSPDFKLLATAQGVGYADVLLWDVKTGTQLGALKDPLWMAIYTLAFTPDGSLLLVSGSPTDSAPYNQPYRVWDVSSRQELGGMAGPDYPFGKILFSSDGTAFMTGDTLWSLPDEKILAVRQAFINFANALNKGDYATATGYYHPYVDDVTYFKSQGVDPTDIPALLKFVCTQASRPCMPVREIAYAGKDEFFDYALLVHFTAPDGTTYKDADGYDSFWMYTDITKTGDIIFHSLPPFPRTT
jgi:WD40 repeat protein